MNTIMYLILQSEEFFSGYGLLTNAPSPSVRKQNNDPNILKYLKNAQLSYFRVFDEKAILFYCI